MAETVSFDGECNGKRFVASIEVRQATMRDAMRRAVLKAEGASYARTHVLDAAEDWLFKMARPDYMAASSGQIVVTNGRGEEVWTLPLSPEQFAELPGDLGSLLDAAVYRQNPSWNPVDALKKSIFPSGSEE